MTEVTAPRDVQIATYVSIGTVSGSSPGEPARHLENGVVVRRTFAHFYPPTAAEFERLWAKGAIVLDTNVLLNLYRYSEASRGEFAAVLETLSDRLWIPHQVALEFHKNRLQVIGEQVSAFDAVIKKLSSARDAFEGDMGAYRKNESIDVASLISRHQLMTTELIESVVSAKNAHPQVPYGADEDPTVILVTALFKDRVGEPFDDDRMKSLLEDGAKRYQLKTPPGYKDADKPEPGRYGDLVLWMQILDQAKTTEQDVLFITDDSKEDWWRKERGKTVGPRPELIREFAMDTGRQVHFYAPQQFLERARDKFGANISQSTYEEVEKLSAQHASDRLHDLVDTRLSAEHVRAQIRETKARLALLDSPRMRPLSSATRLAQIEEELRGLERSKARLVKALNATDDPAERDAATDSLIDIQFDIDRVVLAFTDEQEDQAAMADFPTERQRLNFQLLELNREYEMLAPNDNRS